VKSESTLHNFIVFVIIVPKIVKVGRNLTKFWQKQFCLVFGTRYRKHDGVEKPKFMWTFPTAGVKPVSQLSVQKVTSHWSQG